tara:strand:- start:245 stop:433 length:189 start_codon:yes stop_codon:yes gene_type:complete
MTKYRITFNSGWQLIVRAETINQALASAIRNQRDRDGEIVKVEQYAETPDNYPGNPFERQHH